MVAAWRPRADGGASNAGRSLSTCDGVISSLVQLLLVSGGRDGGADGKLAAEALAGLASRVKPARAEALRLLLPIMRGRLPELQVRILSSSFLMRSVTF